MNNHKRYCELHDYWTKRIELLFGRFPDKFCREEETLRRGARVFCNLAQLFENCARREFNSFELDQHFVAVVNIFVGSVE